MVDPKPLRFTLDDAMAANTEWRFNCGPGALCAVLEMTPAEVRPHLLDFESKGYSNPTLILEVLRNLRVAFKQVYRGDIPVACVEYPAPCLVRVQWDGPWTKAGVPMAARYRHSHWIAVNGPQVFDVNALRYGGWVSWPYWTKTLVPWLLRECEPKATGPWWPTHVLHILGRRAGVQREVIPCG